jgi:hypothetical protein
MRPYRPSSLIAAAIAFAAVAAPLPALATWPHDPNAGVPVAPGPTNQSLPGEDMTVPDGLGGVFVPFGQPNGGGGIDLYLQRMTASGVRAPGWPAAGVLLRSLPSGAGGTRIVPDGAGGAIVVWGDWRTGYYLAYGQRLNASGVAQWPVNGIAVTSISGAIEGYIVGCTDGAGGAFIVYMYQLSGSDYDIYASHLLANGTFTTGVISAPILHQTNPSVASDGAGGFYVSYEDDYSGNDEVKLSHLNPSMAFYFSDINLDGIQPNDQWWSRVLPDGAGGVYVSWLDDRAGFGAHDIYLTHIDAGGGRHPGIWVFGGNPLCTQPGTQSPPLAVLDGSGGLYAFWNDGRPSTPGAYGAHLNGSGTPYPGWPTDGKAVNTFGGNPFPRPVADGAGGVLLATPSYHLTSSYFMIFAEGLTSAGNLGPLSVYGGRCVVQQPVDYVSAVTDNAGGAYVSWSDYSTGVGQVYIQHLDRYATLGEARPTSAGIKDVAADQGGNVRLTWNASWMDGDPDWGIGSYWIWRQSPASLAEAVVASGEGVWADALEPGGAAKAVAAREGGTPGRIFQRDAANATGYAWEFLDSQPADGSAKYSYVAPTASDSITGHNPYTVFMVEAHSALDARAFWQSAPDSAYSVDNLPPVAPAPFTGQYSVGTAALHWGRNGEADLAGYRLYRGASLAFVPGPGNLISAQPDTGYVDAAGAPYVYKLTAIDIHGNESAIAVLVPAGALAVEGSTPHELAFALASANPAGSGATLRFALPAAAGVRIAIYDAAGREVRVLADGAFPAGEFTRAWTGEDGSGRAAASGIYFVRFQSGGREFVKRVALTR